MFRNTVEFEVWGDYALFSDSPTRIGGEKCSCRVPTYEAMKGVLQSIYWKPTIVWVIDEVRVMNKVQMETKGIRTLLWNKKSGDLSYYTYLRDCRYQVRAHFIFNRNRPELKSDWNENKHHNIAKRCIVKGGRRDVFLGTRECQAYAGPCVFGEGPGYYDGSGRESFGRMYHGITYPDEAYDDETKGHLTVRFWDAEMNDGILRFPPPEKCVGRYRRIVKEYSMKEFGTGTNYTIEEEFSEGVR